MRANPILLGRREAAGDDFYKSLPGFADKRAESEGELAEIMERQSSSLTQGGANLLLFNLSQELERRMLSQQ